jgi:hypothetical protein
LLRSVVAISFVRLYHVWNVLVGTRFACGISYVQIYR